MDEANFREGVEIVKRIIEIHYYFGRSLSEIQVRRYENLDDNERRDHLSELMKLDRMAEYWDALVLIAESHIQNGEPFPEPLDEWVIDVLRGERKRGRAYSKSGSGFSYPGKNDRRNYAIIEGIHVLSEYEGWTATRNDASESDSAADAVVRAFREYGKPLSDKDGKAYAIVRRVWRLRKHHATEGKSKRRDIGLEGFYNHIKQGREKVYLDWKEKGFPIYIACKE